MFINLNKKGQSTLEYAIVIAIIVGGLIAMQVYIKRGVQGRLKQASDDIGEQFSAQLTTGNYITNTSANTTENIVPVNVSGDMMSRTTTRTNQTQNRDVSERIRALNQETFD